MELDLAASSTSFWSMLYEHSQFAFGQFFSALNNDWAKGRQSSFGVLRQTTNGPVRGKTFTLLPSGKRVNAFLGVPFARAGTHQQRFMKPFPVERWLEPLECTTYGPRAVQHDLIWDVYMTPIGQDEARCLHINVFAPDWESPEFGANGRPVMVFVHGGGFLIHSSANYGDWNICRNLCLHDVVVCVVQYRLGLLGFMSTGDERCPGNFGLWDQLAAMKWVKENIAYFGGNPNNVTAFGQSAGAASIDLLSISPLSKGLFKRVILMGGNADTDWAIVKPERTQTAAIRIARKWGWKAPDSDLDSLLAFLRAMPAHKLSAPLFGKSAFNRHQKGLEFCPVIDGQIIRAPVAQLRLEMDWPLDVIVGGTEFEALLFLALGRSQSNLISLHKYIKIYIPEETMQVEEIRQRCAKFYLDGVDRNDPLKMSHAFLRLLGDAMFTNSVQRYCHGMLTSPKSHNKRPKEHKIWLYNMTHFNHEEFGFIGFRMPFYAATHCHDLRYLIGKGLYSKFRPNWDDKQMINIMGRLFTNFAKYGNPNAHWRKKLDANDKCCPPWMEEASHGDENNELIQNFDDSPEFAYWQPITAEDTYRHLELCLEPIMRPDYQGRRFEFWRKELGQQPQQEEEGGDMTKRNGHIINLQNGNK